MRRAALACALAACGLMGGAAATVADSFMPVRISISTSSTGRLHGALPVTVTVSADEGVLDTRTAPIRVRVKLAQECGGEFDHTTGVVLLDRRLSPQPDPGRPYLGSAGGSGRPIAYGTQTLCVFLEDEDKLQFATDTSLEVDVTRRCTTAAARYDTAAAALMRARAAVSRSPHSKRLRDLAARRRSAADAAKRSGRSACGSGLPL